MCGLYGLSGYGTEPVRDLHTIINSLAEESAIRGTDACGIAYWARDRLTLYRMAKNAMLVNFKPHQKSKVVMGHTRHGTGGKNSVENAHPFPGRCDVPFALAHNGILHNDSILRSKYGLPRTKVETDSYVAVQLLEKKKKLDMDSLKFMAEAVTGSFSFTVLDETGTLYFVKGDSPLHLLHFPRQQLYVYASTEQILWKALMNTHLFYDLKKGWYEEIQIGSGEILKLTAAGKTKRSSFHYEELRFLGSWYHYVEHSEEYIDDLKSVASCMGYSSQDIDALLSEGFMPEEIEDFLYDGEGVVT